MRLSGKFIQCLVGSRFQRQESIDTNVEGVAVAGAAQVAGTIRVQLLESDAQSAFDIHLDGAVHSQLTATRSPVVVRAHGVAPFVGSRRIECKDDRFHAGLLNLDVCNRFSLDAICPFQGGLTGAVTERIARPFVRRGLADGDVYANREIQKRMNEGQQAELAKLTAALDKIPPLVKQAHELIILESKRPAEPAQSYCAATTTHLLFSRGLPGKRIPSLPILEKERQAPLELWIGVSKDTAREERRNFMVQNWRLIVPFLRDQLQSRSPDLTKGLEPSLAKLLDEVQVYKLPDWHVVTFAPKIPLSNIP